MNKTDETPCLHCAIHEAIAECTGGEMNAANLLSALASVVADFLGAIEQNTDRETARKCVFEFSLDLGAKWAARRNEQHGRMN